MSVVFSSRIPQVSAAATAKADIVVGKAAADIEAQAKETVPVDTGNLKASIASSRTGPLEARVTASAEYAAYVELGTRHTSPQPYMVSAAEAVRPSFYAAMAQIVK